jgi:nucleoside-diphosphate-sugar epimerase
VWGPHPYCRWQLRAAAGHRFFEAVRAGTPLLLPGATSAASDAFGHAWVDAREIATAIVECLRRPSGTPLNIVNEHFSWSAFYTVLAELTGPRPTVGFGAPTDDFHHLRRQYSTVRARQHLGFQPVHDWRATLTELIDAAPTVPTQRPPASTN